VVKIVKEENGTNNNSENANDGQDNVALRDLRGVFITAVWALIFLVLVAKFWPNLPQRMSFFTGNLFNLIIAFAVIAQVAIYRKQWQIMREQFVRTERAYVGIKSFESPPREKNPIMKLHNIGKQPADSVGVEIQMILLCPPEMVKRNPELFKPAVAPDMIWISFLRTKLFPAGVCFEVEIPLTESFSDTLILNLFAGQIRLIIQVRLKYKDGFDGVQSDYAFRWDSGGWRAWPVWTFDDLPNRIAEEQSRYHPK
jgi:hypothetical protein